MSNLPPLEFFLCLRGSGVIGHKFLFLLNPELNTNERKISFKFNFVSRGTKMSQTILIFAAILFRQMSGGALLTDFPNDLLLDADLVDDEGENSLPYDLDDIVFNGNLGIS